MIFLVGSALSGFSHSMFELIAFRAVQGLGGGGLMIGAQAIVGDVVSPRDRGRYMGLFGAMFGVATVLGPLLGGLLREVPVVALGLLHQHPDRGRGALRHRRAASGPPAPGAPRHRLPGHGPLAGSTTSLVLFTSLGGTTYPWGSAPIIAMAVAGVVLAVAFLMVERRAAEPVIPLELFANRVFSAASAIGFVMGFAMFGALTFLPLLPEREGGQPHGVGAAPPAADGRAAGRLGRLGPAGEPLGPLQGVPGRRHLPHDRGLLLMSMIGLDHRAWVIAGYMFVFGVGLGLVMQVLVVAVQNAVPYEQLGAATCRPPSSG